MITVGISCYNVAPYIGRCIASVCGQTYRDLEILIVDDGSTDTSGTICDTFAAKDDRVRVIHQENAGPGSARNTVLDAAQGDFIAFIDGDDYVEPDMLQQMTDAILESGCDMAICAYVAESVGDTDGETNARREHTAQAPRRLFSKDELLQAYIEEDERYPIRNAVWNKLTRSACIKPLRMPEQMQYEDILFSMKLLDAVNGAVFVDTPLYHYIIDREDSIMNRGMNKGVLTDQIPAYRERSAFFREKGREDLVRTHDYLVCKKLLLLYKETFTRGMGGEGRVLRKELKTALLEFLQDLEQMRTSPVADPHQILRMRLFRIHPWLFDLFCVVNDGLLHRIRGIA